MTLLTKRFSKLSTKLFMVFYLWSCRERVFLCILQYLKKGRWHYVPKCFPTYQPNYLWVFIFKSREKGVFFQKTGFWRTLLSIFMNCFSLHLWKKGIYETIHQKIFQLIIQIIYGFLFLKVERNVFLCVKQGFWKAFYKPYYYATVNLLVNSDT